MSSWPLEWTEGALPAASHLQANPEMQPPISTKFSARNVLCAELKEVQGAIAEAATRATSRSNITLEPEEEGWSIRVNDEVAIHPPISDPNAKELLQGTEVNVKCLPRPSQMPPAQGSGDEISYECQAEESGPPDDPNRDNNLSGAM
jgi:hypothetical protein